MGHPVYLKKPSTAKGILRHALYFGMQARVADQLGVTRSIVSRVAKGTKTSKRISAALHREAARIERQIVRSQERAA